MTQANITARLIRFAQTLVGHLRSGLAHVVSLSSMLFAGISGSMTADVAAISTVVMPHMEEEGYDPAFSAALVASASTTRPWCPQHHGHRVRRGRQCLDRRTVLGRCDAGPHGRGRAHALQLFSGPPGLRKQRATLGAMAGATRLALLPLMIPIIIVGGVASGVFTPAEAGMIAVVYIIVVLLPLMARGHIRRLPRDFVEAAVLYSLPMSAVAAASAVGWLMAYLDAPDIVHRWIEAVSGDNRIVIMYLMVVVLTIAGDFLDGVPAIAIFMPIIISLAQLGHIHPVHMGVLIIVSLAFGLITPPYGLILLLSSTLAGISFTRALRQAVPLYCVYFLVISVIIFFPNVVLWLPRLVIPTSVGCFPSPTGGGFICPP
jgi:TRAP-type C4-dicarboxylate transport system permease large subunit